MAKIEADVPLFTGQDLLVNGIMSQPLIHYPPSVNPLKAIPDTEIMTVIGAQGPVAIKGNYPLPARDFVGVDIPSSSPAIEALATANKPPQYMLEHELHGELGLRPEKDYLLVGVQDQHDAKAFAQGMASHYLLLVNKKAYKKMAVAALNDLADPQLGLLLTHPARMAACHKVIVPAARQFSIPFQQQGNMLSGGARDYCKEIKDPNSPVSKLIERIMQQAEIPDLDAKAVVATAAERDNIEMAGKVSGILKARSPDFTTHVLGGRSAGGERTPS